MGRARKSAFGRVGGSEVGSAVLKRSEQRAVLAAVKRAAGGDEDAAQDAFTLAWKKRPAATVAELTKLAKEIARTIRASRKKKSGNEATDDEIVGRAANGAGPQYASKKRELPAGYVRVSGPKGERGVLRGKVNERGDFVPPPSGGVPFSDPELRSAVLDLYDLVSSLVTETVTKPHAKITKVLRGVVSPNVLIDATRAEQIRRAALAAFGGKGARDWIHVGWSLATQIDRAKRDELTGAGEPHAAEIAAPFAAFPSSKWVTVELVQRCLNGSELGRGGGSGRRRERRKSITAAVWDELNAARRTAGLRPLASRLRSRISP
jgi:hypothetical protein